MNQDLLQLTQKRLQQINIDSSDGASEFYLEMTEHNDSEEAARHIRMRDA